MFWSHVQVHNETVQLHLVAALQSLHRESELLPAAQREVLTVMLREHGLTAGMQTASSQPSGHRRSFTGSSDGSISSGHLVAGNHSLPGLPRASAGVTRRPSDASQGGCNSSADAVALQRVHLAIACSLCSNGGLQVRTVAMTGCNTACTGRPYTAVCLC